MINTVIIMGKVARDPRVNATSLMFTVKTSESYKDKEGQTKWDNQYHNITLFGQAAARIGRLIQDGTEVFVEGRLSTYKDKTGAYRTSILARTVRVLGGTRENDDDMGSFPSDPITVINEENDIPF